MVEKVKLTARDILAIIMTVASFALIGGFLFTGGRLDSGTGVALSVFCTAPISALLGFYFGRVNGQTEANISNLLDNQRTIISQLPPTTVSK
jgi:hypothetical protein